MGSGGGGGSATKRPLSSVWPVALFQSFELAFFSLRSIDDFFCAPPLFSGCIGRRIDGHGAASTRPAALRRQRRRFAQRGNEKCGADFPAPRARGSAAEAAKEAAEVPAPPASRTGRCSARRERCKISLHAACAWRRAASSTYIAESAGGAAACVSCVGLPLVPISSVEQSHQ